MTVDKTPDPPMARLPTRALTSRKTWGVVLLLALGALAVQCALGIGSIAYLFGGLDDVGRELSRISGVSSRAPAGSIVMLGHDTVAHIVEIAGVQRDGSVPDSLLMFRAEPTRRANLWTVDSTWVAFMEPRNEWVSPIVLSLRQPPVDRASSLGFLFLQPSMLRIRVVEVPH